MKILAIKLRAIGDTVIWTAALAALRAQFPDATIHVLTYPSNVAVLQNSRAVDEIHTLSSKSKWSLLKALWRLRGQGFDWLLAFHATKSLCQWAWLVGAKKMVLHHHSWAYTPRGSERIDQPGALLDAVDRDLETIRAMGFEPQRLPTHIEIQAHEKEWAEAIVQSHILEGGDPPLRRFAFLPGASHHLRRYPRDQWLKLVEKMKTERKFQPLVICDAALAEEWGLEEECRRLRVPLFKGGSLREFILLISRASRALANDSGPGHIAVACGVQTDFVFGPGCVGDWFPYRDTQHNLHRIEVDCRRQGPEQSSTEFDKFRYCTVDKCEHHSCLRKLTIHLE